MTQYPKYNLALRLAGTIFQLLFVFVPLAILVLFLLQALFVLDVGSYLTALFSWLGIMAGIGLGLLLLGGMWASR